MVSEVHRSLSLDAHSDVVEGHPRLLQPVKCAMRVVFCPLNRAQLLIAVVVPWIEALLGIGSSHIEQRVAPRVPATIANVEAADK